MHTAVGTAAPRNQSSNGRVRVFGGDPNLQALLDQWQALNIDRTLGFDLTETDSRYANRLNRYYTIQVPTGTNTPELVRLLQAFPEVIESAELDGIGGVMDAPLPLDPFFRQQYYLENTGQLIEGQSGVAGADARVRDAWQLTTGSPSVVIAVLDTGVSQSHPDLVGKTVPGQNFTVSPPNANTEDSWYISHGTECAGVIAAATNNQTGMAGIAWNSLIMPVKIANVFGMSSESQCGSGLVWATDRGARVASISLGFALGTSYLSDAVNYALARNVVVCASAGNTPGVPLFFPARYPNVISVGATTNQDELATFTTTGPELFLAAPGVDVLTTTDTLGSPDTYTYQSGTSFSCPIVAGVVGLVISASPQLSNEQVRFILLLTADDLGEPGRDDSYGWGRVNALSAVTLASDHSPIECDADWNRDRQVDTNDVFTFLENYFDGNADFNHDGSNNSHDLFEFLEHFFAGC